MCDYNKIFGEIAEYRMMKVEIEKRLDELESEIKDYMKAESMTELLGNEHKACYSAVTSNRFDTTAFKKDHADMAKMYMKQSTSMRFTFN